MEKQFTICKLKFKHGVHISAGGFGEENSEVLIHSDTIFSALVNAASLLYPREVSEALLQPGKIRISSAFPYFREEYFLARPLTFFPSFKDGSYAEEKSFKKVRFISKVHMDNFLQGKEKEILYSEDHLVNTCFSSMPVSDPSGIFIQREISRTSVDRLSNASNIFNFSELWFNPEGGLYFFAETDESLKDIFLNSLRLLGDEGLGADRTSGKGLFTIKEEKLSFNVSESTDSFLMLSLYSPSEDEINDLALDKSSYDLITRHGWINRSTFRRKAQRMFLEGSVLAFKNGRTPSGTIHKVLGKEDHPNCDYDIYRSGQAFVLPIGSNSHGNN